MIDHQHSILRTLGIDLWIPRETVCVEIAATSLWRDQETPEAEVMMADLTRMTELPKVDLQPLVQLAIQAKPVLSQREQFSTAIPALAIVPSESDLQTFIEPMADEGICPAFQLQALVVSGYTLVTDSTHFNEQQWALWHNLKQALSAKNTALEWPFPLLHIQDARGVVCYIQGFLDATGVGQTVLILGELPHIHMRTDWEKMPSIQQLLDQALLKKQLWQRLYQGE